MVSARSLNKRSTTILIAAILALGTGLLAFNYLSTLNHVAQVVPMRSIVVATQEIPVRTVITPSMVTLTDRPADSVDPDALSASSAVVGQIALITIPQNGSVSASKIGHVGLGGLTEHIPAGTRAVSISLDKVKGVADLIEAGDRVDVIAVAAPKSGQGNPVVTTILKNKLVLAMGTAQEAPAAAGTASPPPNDVQIETATLAVTPAEAKTLTLADISATLRLALRSQHDVRGSDKAEPFVLPTAEPIAGAPAAASAPAHAAAAAASPKPKRSGPPYIDGDHYVN